MFYVLLLTDKTRAVLSQAPLTQEQILSVSLLFSSVSEVSAMPKSCGVFEFQ